MIILNNLKLNSKFLKKGIFLFLTLQFFNCKTVQKQTSENNIIWIDLKKTTCENGNSNCFKINFNDSLNIELINNSNEIVEITNFYFEEGYYYKLKIEKKTINQYNCLSVIEKHYGPQMFLTGKWKLVEVNNKKLKELTSNINIKNPIIEFDLFKNKISGHDGCNQINGNFNILNHNKIKFSNIINTKMICVDMTIPNLFHNNIYTITEYSVVNGILRLLNKEKTGLLVFEQI